MSDTKTAWTLIPGFSMVFASIMVTATAYAAAVQDNTPLGHQPVAIVDGQYLANLLGQLSRRSGVGN